ncbi:MAG TPA: hypothetical protein DCG57_07465 [Candidatus Riflebacteria bacterium]|jgi:glycosyltransferase involved in cell wall biosynthesis|nr:hypothetical protein [Candidatus Riflebacteria bacterium]
MKRIAQVTHNYLPHLGGIEFYVKRLFEDLARSNNGFIVDILTTDLDTPTLNRKEEARYFPVDVAFMRNPFSTRLVSHLRKHPYDLMHLHSIWFLPCLLAVIFRKRARIITTIHGVFPDKASILLRLFLSLYKPLALYILKCSDRIVVLSESERRKLLNHFSIEAENVVVIPNGICIEAHEPVEKESIVLFTGRIIPDKNPDVLIEAVAKLKNRISSLRIVFVGPIEESYRIELMQLAQNLKVATLIEFVAPLDQSFPEEKALLMNLYRRAKVFVSLGAWEGLPTRIMEAMQFETACITYSSGGSSDLVIDGYNGIVIVELDAELLASRLEKVLLNDDFRATLGINARKTILEKYDWNKISQKLISLYEEILGHY